MVLRNGEGRRTVPRRDDNSYHGLAVLTGVWGVELKIYEPHLCRSEWGQKGWNCTTAAFQLGLPFNGKPS